MQFYGRSYGFSRILKNVSLLFLPTLYLVENVNRGKIEEDDKKSSVGNAIISQLMCVCATLIAYHWYGSPAWH